MEITDDIGLLFSFSADELTRNAVDKLTARMDVCITMGTLWGARLPIHFDVDFYVYSCGSQGT